MSRVLRYGAFLLLLLIAGCSLIPSTWRIGGSPLAKEEKAEAKKAEAREQVLLGAQETAHMTELLLTDSKSDEPAVTEARGYAVQTIDLLDQALGVPSAANAEKWRRLAAGLVTDNATLRAQAKAAQGDRARGVSSVSERFARATAATQRANARALDYARESEGLADFTRKLKLGFYGLIGLIVLGTVLSLAARFFPALGLASKVINGVVAPGITYVAHRAQDGLARVGQGMANLRATATNAEELIERCFDGPVDADQKTIIAAAAAAASTRPPPLTP
jgi:ABC-type multidrug transport system fused ATPase/permease subunit